MSCTTSPLSAKGHEEFPIMGIRKAFEEKVSAQLDEWNSEIEKLEAESKAERAKADADKADAELQREVYGRIDELRNKIDGARKRLHEMRDAGDEAWEGLKGNLDKTMTDLANAFRSSPREGQ
jgi:hypothetical protein